MIKRPKGLGRGLDALLGGEPPPPCGCFGAADAAGCATAPRQVPAAHTHGSAGPG